MTTADVDILVAGAGPTGLALALQADLHGARVRVVERRTDAFRPSRAMVMHPRTLEVLRPLGVTDALLAAGDVSPSVRLHLGSRVVPVRLAELDLPDTAFPHLLLIRQADVETVLDHALAGHGVRVERGTRLVDVHRQAGGCVAVLDTGGVREEVSCSYIAGCDGAGSTVRRLAGIGWCGAPYRQEIVLADLELNGEFELGGAHVVAGRRGLLFVFAGGEHATWRLLATRPAGPDDLPLGQVGPAVPVEEVQSLLSDAGLGAAVTEVAWSARVRLQHGIASRFRAGRLFLAGDAAHAHSPAGAQGMNLGIQDATNLGWKLAFGAAGSLDSYQSERRPVARQVLALTHGLFWAEAGTDPVASLARGVLAPLAAPVVPLVMGRRRLVAVVVRTLSGLRVGYRDGPLSLEGRTPAAGLPRPGDRVPDSDVCCDGRWTRLHQLLAGAGIHVLLQRDTASLDEPIAGDHVRVHRITSWPGAGVLAVRPDGYAGFRSGRLDPQLADWLALVGAPPSGR
jgi:2-polyprenyl-6-methoxyphenol hydroxylase-like FAD-dependent oxidoreductase